MTADLDDLLTALYVLADDFLPGRPKWMFVPALPAAAADGMPIAFELGPASAPEREVVAAMLERVELDGYTVIGHKGLSGAEIEELVAALGGAFLRPDRRDEPSRFGNLGGVRQWIEAIFDQLKDQLSLERHCAHTMAGLMARIDVAPNRVAALRFRSHRNGLCHLLPGWAG